MYSIVRKISGWLAIQFFALLLDVTAGYGQVYPHLNYSVRQGLVNSNVYAMVQDKVGYIWLGTENGLSRFDGIHFQNYTLEQLDLKSNISSLATTNDGKIILGSSSGIFIFDPITEKITQLTRKVILRSNQIIRMDDLIISMHENRGFDFISLKSGEILLGDTVLINNCINKALSMIKINHEEILLGRSDGLYRFIGNKQIKMQIRGMGNIPVYSICEYKNSLLIGSDGLILRVANNEVIDTLQNFNAENKLVRNISTDIRGNVWFNVWGSKEIYMISDNNTINVSDAAGILNGTITKILMESSGTVIVSTIGKGIFLFTNNHFLVYPESEKFTNSNVHKIIKTSRGGLLLGTDDGLAYLDSKGKDINSIKHLPGRIEYIRDIALAPGNQYVVATIDIKFANTFSESFTCDYEDIKVRYLHCSSLWADSLSVVIGNWDNKLVQYQLPDFRFAKARETIFDIIHNTHRINCLQNDEFGRMWIGSQRGLCIINREGEKYFPQGLFQNEEIFKISYLQYGKLLVVTSGGFYFIKNNSEDSLISEINRTAIPGINCIALTGENEYLVGTNHGLIFMKDNKLQRMDIHDGVLSDNINDILHIQGQSIAWIATTEGLMQVDLEALRRGIVAPLEIRQVKINQDGKDWLPLETNTFNYNSGSFSINFQAFNYHNPQKIRYQYKVDDGDWLPSPSNEIQFASMADGNHNILLRAGLPESTWGPVKAINILVLPPFYRTWWFYLLVLISGVILILVIIKWQFRKFKNKQEEKVIIQRNMVELQQKALASNLNPHFVFNSLNAIQHFINSKNPAEANEYLAKFARLMRMHLNMAEKSSILLYEEIQRLEYYLSLEQMRFDDKMGWSISVDPKLDPFHLEIPNMIIQPFVENAIWHGIMPSTQIGLISLVIEPVQNDGLLITVTDNGVGFSHQPKPSQNQHESKGTRLIRERLLLLDPIASDVLRFEHLSPGTKVSITLTSKMYRKTIAEDPVLQD